MRFTVKWKNYSECTTESWFDLKNNVAFHSYLRKHNMDQLIPARFYKNSY